MHKHLTALEMQSHLSSLNHILTLRSKTILIICASKADFQTSLLREVTVSSSSSSATEPGNPALSTLHPTIAHLSASNEIEIRFASTLMHFRAILGELSCSESSSTARTSAPADPTILAILGLPQLHLDAGDLSAQSLARSLALVVEVGSKIAMDVLFLCSPFTRESESVSVGEEGLSDHDTCLWEQRIPVISSSLRGGHDGVGSGRRVMLGNVFGQWCDVNRA